MSGDKALTIYKIHHRNNSEWLIANDDRDFERLRFDGKPRAGSWNPVAVSLLKDPYGGPPRPYDFLTGSDGLMMNDVARAKLEPHLASYGEFLPLKCDAGKYWTFNVMHLVDAFDEDASELMRGETGNILMIKKHVFRPEKLKGLLLFKPSQIPHGPVYVTDSFENLVKAFGLTGLVFKRVWPHQVGDMHRWF